MKHDIRVRKRDPDVRMAWQYDGLPHDHKPQWVTNSTRVYDGELLLVRQSGSQAIYKGEWLVKMVDGGIEHLTDLAFRREYEGVI